MVEFETIESAEIQLDNGFIVVASKKAISENGDEREFISMTKGFDRDGNRKFKQTVTIPRNAEVVDEVAEALKSVV